MKILVISLLRLGDIIQQGSLLRGLRIKYPEATIHLLINRQFQSVEEILKNTVDKYVYFDRDLLQRGLVDASCNILFSYDLLSETIQLLNSESYDQAYNFTHTKLSGYLLGALKVSEKNGLYYSSGKFRGLENPWLKYFNNRFSGNQKSLFHYTELLSNSFNIPISNGSKINRQMASKTIYMQTLTSDKKKNWGLEKYRELKEVLEKSLVDYRVQVLGADFEREELLQFFKKEDLLICSLSQVQDHLKNAGLLVTGDTSIKHLAAQMEVPIVEISIGSSDPDKTSALSADAKILASSVPCYPCIHSSACSQKSHLCSEQISVENVFEAIWETLSKESRKNVDYEKSLNRIAWTLYLNSLSASSKPVLSFEDQIIEIVSQHGETAIFKWKQVNACFRGWIERLNAAAPLIEKLRGKEKISSHDMNEVILTLQEVLKSGIDKGNYFQIAIEALTEKYSSPDQLIEMMQVALVEVNALFNQRLVVAEMLETIFKGETYYAKGIGKLPISGFAEARETQQRSNEDAEL